MTTNGKWSRPIDPEAASGPVLQWTEKSGSFEYARFMTTRAGGVSRGAYATFNLGAFCGDDPACVAENRRRLCRWLSVDPAALLVPRQVHADRVLAVDRDLLALPAGAREQALDGYDALLTDLPGIALGITTADCTPVVCWDPVRGVVAAAHAGWRGTAQRIAHRVVERMRTLYGCDPADIRATVLPCIGASAYPVGAEVVQALADAGIDTAAVTERLPSGRETYTVDLAAANRQILLQSGLQESRIDRPDACTYTRDVWFFSARRQGLASGRMLSGVLIRPVGE